MVREVHKETHKKIAGSRRRALGLLEFGTAFRREHLRNDKMSFHFYSTKNELSADPTVLVWQNSNFKDSETFNTFLKYYFS